MKTYLSLIFVFLSFWGCKCISEPDPELTLSPEGMYQYFKNSIRCSNFYKAYYILSKQTRRFITYDEFYMGLRNFPLLKRLLLGFKPIKIRIDKDYGRLLLWNREANFKMDIFIKKEIGYWTVELSRSEFEKLLKFVEKWHEFLMEEFDGRKYIIPPYWELRPFKKSFQD